MKRSGLCGRGAVCPGTCEWVGGLAGGGGSLRRLIPPPEIAAVWREKGETRSGNTAEDSQAIVGHAAYGSGFSVCACACEKERVGDHRGERSICFSLTHLNHMEIGSKFRRRLTPPQDVFSTVFRHLKI